MTFLQKNDILGEMIGNKIGHRLDPFLYKVLSKVFGERGNPNSFTLMGFFATLIASIFILKEFWVAAGLMIILSGLFDLFDGVVARKLGKVTAFGGFLDSVLDRYSDLLLLLALLIHYLRKENSASGHSHFFRSIGTALIPYVRAKAEVHPDSLQCRTNGEGGTDHSPLCWGPYSNGWNQFSGSLPFSHTSRSFIESTMCGKNFVPLQNRIRIRIRRFNNEVQHLG